MSFKNGQKMARKILTDMVGKKRAKAMWGVIRWGYSEILPKDIQNDYGVEFRWMGFCCPMTDGSQTILINPAEHKRGREIALTIGHELAHVLQNAMKGAGKANHEDEIFSVFRKCFCDALGFTEDSF